MPSSVIADSQSFAKLDSGNTTLIGDTKIDCPEQNGQMGAVHNRSSGNGGLVTAESALADVPVANGIILLLASAFGAHEPLWKTLTKQFFPACIIYLILGTKFFETDCLRFCHDDALCFFF